MRRLAWLLADISGLSLLAAYVRARPDTGRADAALAETLSVASLPWNGAP